MFWLIQVRLSVLGVICHSSRQVNTLRPSVPGSRSGKECSRLSNRYCTCIMCIKPAIMFNYFLLTYFTQTNTHPVYIDVDVVFVVSELLDNCKTPRPPSTLLSLPSLPLSSLSLPSPPSLSPLSSLSLPSLSLLSPSSSFSSYSNNRYYSSSNSSLKSSSKFRGSLPSSRQELPLHKSLFLSNRK